jgi:uncharacterized membrane protein
VRRWAPLAVLVLAEIGYPLVHGSARTALVVLTVVLGFLASVLHAWRRAVPLLVITTLGGLAVEALGVATGFPFGHYAYGAALGPKLLGVPLVIPLAWTWMAWPAWIVAGRITGDGRLRPLVAGVGLASWDLFLDPQMVAEHYWRWSDPHPALPGVPDVPLSNYLGWLVVAIVMMSLLSFALGRSSTSDGDAPMVALFLWTYGSSVLAHAVFLGLPASAGWGALGMGLVAVPLIWKLVR